MDNVKTLSAMLGHVSAATTLDIYTHITDDMRYDQSGMEALDCTLGFAHMQITSCMAQFSPCMT